MSEQIGPGPSCLWCGGDYGEHSATCQRPRYMDGKINTPTVKHGRFHAGKDFVCGENVVIDVDEEVVLGDRCVLGDNTYISGRRVTIGNDFFGYSWEWRRLDVGRGRRGCEHAILTVGDRCTFHDNRIDLARQITIGDDVGLSPEVAVYTHWYWNIKLGYKYAPVTICDNVLVGFRSVLVPGTVVGPACVIGAGSVVHGQLSSHWIYAGNPARMVRPVEVLTLDKIIADLTRIMVEYVESRKCRGLEQLCIKVFPESGDFHLGKNYFDLKKRTVEGEENEDTDDLRDFLFKHGFRFYTQRPFRRKL